MKLYIIDYYNKNGEIGDCYPDFCYSQKEAETIAPVFMKEIPWAHSWQIRVEEDND